MATDDNTFYLGVTMAGAVSAGAYTAGVLDYLFRALDAHNARVARGPTEDDPDPPRHRVVLKVMSGASAGGVCAGLSVASLIKAQAPGTARLRAPERLTYDAVREDGEPAQGEVDYVLGPLFDAWVEGLDLWDTQRGDGLLGVSDVDRPDAGSIASLFDSGHIDRVSERVLGDVIWGGDANGSRVAGRPYSFVARDLELFLTTTDLRGVPYTISFAGAGGAIGSEATKDVPYAMTQHSIARHFRVSGLGADSLGSPWLDAWRDDGVRLELPSDQPAPVPIPFNDDGEPWHALKISAIASGAFPAGLAPRRIDATATQLGVLDRSGRAQGGAIPIELDWSSQMPPRPRLGESITADASTPFVAVDGGVANNEPFELARFTLRSSHRDNKYRLLTNPRGADVADRAVIMIDPFPEGPEYTLLDAEAGNRLLGLVASALSLVQTLLRQARFKSSELVHASDPNIYSRFLVAPRRSGAPDATGADAIAGGAFDGFSGFFDRSFRLHDFVLGQRNCQHFLNSYFVLAPENHVLGLEPSHPAVINEVRRPVVDPGPAMSAKPILLPRWPQISDERLSTLKARGDRRLEILGMRVIESFKLSLVLRVAARWLWRGLWPFGSVRSRWLQTVSNVVVRTLIRRDQLASCRSLSPLERAVVLKLLAAKQPMLVLELVDAVREGRPEQEARDITPDAMTKLVEALRDRGFARRHRALPGAPPRYGPAA